MSISAVSGSDVYALYNQRRLDFKTLAGAVQAGDTTAAQTALKSYQADAQSIASASGATDANEASPFATKIKTDLTGLTSAIQSGDMTSAQSALQTYAQDRQSSVDASGGGSSGTANDLTGLISSIQSGDTSSTQTSADALIKDLQSLIQGSGTEGAHKHHHHGGGASPAGATDSIASIQMDGTTAASATSTSAGTSDTTSTDPLMKLLNEITEALSGTTLGASQTTA